MKKTIFLIMLLLLSTFAIAANTDVTSGVGRSNAIGVNETYKDEELESEIELEFETEFELENETESEDEEKIELETEAEIESENDNQVNNQRLNQKIRQRVEAGFSVEAQEQLRQRFNNISESNKEELKEKLAEMKKEFLEKKQEFGNEVKSNREEAHAAVQALRLAGNYTGTDIAEIMHNYNEELKETLRSEEQIQNRSKVARFFAGGDDKVAARLELQIGRNNERIEEVKIRLEAIDDEELKSELEEHLAALEKNQERLQNVAEDEKKSKGIFGWIWK